MKNKYFAVGIALTGLVLLGGKASLAHAGTSSYGAPSTGSITVCKVIENASGTIVDGSAFPGETFTIPGVSSVPAGTPAITGVLPATTFTTPLTLNTALFGSSTNNAQCVTYSSLTLGNYYYGQESIASTSSEWATPVYNDQYTGDATSLSDFFPYNTEYFDADPSNNADAEAGTHVDANGRINLLLPRGPQREIIVLNQYLGTTVVTPPPTPVASLSIVKTVDNANPHEGDTINYTLTVSAAGPATSTAVVAKDVLPSGVTFISATSSEGTYASSTGTWTVGTMSASSTATLTIAATVNAGTAGQTITNNATVAESTSETNPSTNTSSSVPVTVAANQLGSITVCKVIENASGTIVDGSAFPANTFTVPGLLPPSSTSSVVGLLATTTFTTPLSFNTALFGSSTNNAQCVTYNNLPIGDYYYGQEVIATSSGEWATPLYNDEYTVGASSTSDFFSYNDQLFNDPANAASRNQNADGEISLLDSRPDRQLVILNQFTGTVSTTTPPASEIVNLGGIEDLQTTSTIEGVGDFNDVIFSFSPSSTVRVASQNGVLNPLTSNLVNESGTIYWDNPSLDGPQENIGYCVLGNGNCPSIGGPFSNVQYLAEPNGVQVSDVTFTASGPVTMNLLARVAADQNAVGWYDPSNPSVLHTIFSGSDATGTSVTFTPSSVFGLYLANLTTGNTFPSQNTGKQHFALFDVGFPCPSSTITTPTSTPTSTPSADLSITKTVDNANPAVGNTVNYTLTVAALGPATSTGVVATDTLPSGLTFENATASIGSYASSTGTWTIGNLSASSTATLNIAAIVNAGEAGQTITNTAIVGESASSTDNNLSNNSSSVPVTVQSNGCTSNCGGGTPTITTSTLTVNVSGLNASDTAEVLVQDLTASTTQSTSTGNGSSTFVLTTNDNYAVIATTTNPNYTMATSTGCSGKLSANATCNITFTFVSQTPSTDADISITKTVDNTNPAGGATVNYTITVTDLGPASSTIVNAQDILPMGLSLVSATTSVGMYDLSTGNWAIGTLGPNATATLLIAATVDPRLDGQTITNTATVTQLSSIVDQNPGNNSSSVAIDVQPAPCTSNCGGGTSGGGGGGGGGGEPTAEIGITKTVDNANPNPGQTINYTLTVEALGPSESMDVVASDTLPAGVTFVSASSSMGTYNSSTGTWTLGDVVEGSKPTLVITATVNSTDPVGETITNTATVGEDTDGINDPLTANNTASVTITVGGTSNTGGGGTSGGGGSTSGGGGGSVGVGGGGGGSSTGGGQVLGASASCGIYLDQYIHPIRKYLNDPTEVKKLQVFLNMNLGLNLPVDGYYGASTIVAVDQFQVKYHIEVLEPWLNYGLPTEYTPTDYVYKTTQRWINLIMCSSLNLPIPQLP